MFLLDTSKSFNGDKTKYIEAGQHIPCKFAPVILERNTAYIQTSPFMCREFFCDMLAWRELGEKVKYSEIYRLKRFDHLTREMDLAIYLNGTKDPSIKLKYLHVIEDALGFKRTVIIPVKGGEFASAPVVISTGDKRWQQNSILVTLYTYLLRQLCGAHEGFIFSNAYKEYNDPVRIAKAALEIKTPFHPQLLELLAADPYDSGIIHESSGFIASLTNPTNYSKDFRNRYRKVA